MYDDLANMMRTREGIYSLLYTVYVKELTQEQIEALAAMDFSSLEGLDPQIAEGAHMVRRYLRRLRSEMRQELAVDYAHLFYAAGSAKHERRAVPYESVFTSIEGLLMQDARDEVLRYMLAEHVEPNPELHVPEDHVAFIFDVMSTLCDRCADAAERGDEAEAQRLLEVQRQFQAEHIASWIDEFCDAVEGCCRTAFYGGFSRITRGFARLDQELLGDLEQELARAS